MDLEQGETTAGGLAVVVACIEEPDRRARPTRTTTGVSAVEPVIETAALGNDALRARTWTFSASTRGRNIAGGRANDFCCVCPALPMRRSTKEIVSDEHVAL
jgi:hypothetical protein